MGKKLPEKQLKARIYCSKSNMTTAEASVFCKCSQDTLRAWSHYTGYKFVRNNGHKPDTINKVVELANQGMTDYSIMKETNLPDVDTVKRIRHKLGMFKRKNGKRNK